MSWILMKVTINKTFVYEHAIQPRLFHIMTPVPTQNFSSTAPAYLGRHIRTHDTERRLCSTISLLFQPLTEISPIAVTISLHLPSATLPNTVLDLKVPLIVYKSWLITFLFNHWSETSNYKAMPQWHCIYLSVLTRVQKYDDYYSYLSKPKQN